jgi:hypothetical protein
MKLRRSEAGIAIRRRRRPHKWLEATPEIIRQLGKWRGCCECGERMMPSIFLGGLKSNTGGRRQEEEEDKGRKEEDEENKSGRGEARRKMKEEGRRRRKDGSLRRMGGKKRRRKEGRRMN